MTSVEPDLVEHLAVLHLEPGDVLVLTYPEEISAAAASRLKELINDALPNHEAVVLSGGVQMGAVRFSE